MGRNEETRVEKEGIRIDTEERRMGKNKIE